MVVLTCPEEVESNTAKWEKDGVLIQGANKTQHVMPTFSEVEDSGSYTCYSDSSKKNSLYLKARVCKNCIEVTLMMVVAIIIADICFTLGLLLLVYYWSKKRKTNATAVMRTKGAGGRTRGKS
ncbi:unnamed protein product [Gulo gulo]|uniref:Ig-like domain-containing protein n=1 Tax=Gulo gulo TaxID=48420 RepID=A0A9X9LHX3_GULGU|nr:unnamed protein product [Gulo gulo]